MLKTLKNGILTENPTFVLLLGMCPTLAVTTSLKNGIGMGLSTMAVLIMSNLAISLLRKIIPDKIRIASYVIIIAGFVTIVDLLLQAFLPSLAESLGMYIPLIVVNCIILARAEAFASKNTPLASMCDGLSMGIGFTLALIIISSVREILGNGTIYDVPIPFISQNPAITMILPPGGFLTLGLLMGLVNLIKMKGGSSRG